MNKKIVRVLGKRGRITIPYQIRVRNKIGYNDILSFEEKDANTEMLKDYMPSLILSIVMGVAAYFIGETNLINTVFTLVLQIIIGALIYLAGAKLLRMKELIEVEDKLRPYINNKINRNSNKQ